MKDGIFYLNNSGSKWIVLINGKKEKRTFTTKSGKQIERTIIRYESFGNFGSAIISYKGKLISVLSDSILED
jgi:hypothetical protein